MGKQRHRRLRAGSAYPPVVLFSLPLSSSSSVPQEVEKVSCSGTWRSLPKAGTEEVTKCLSPSQVHPNPHGRQAVRTETFAILVHVQGGPGRVKALPTLLCMPVGEALADGKRNCCGTEHLMLRFSFCINLEKWPKGNYSLPWLYLPSSIEVW